MTITAIANICEFRGENSVLLRTLDGTVFPLHI